MKRVLCIAFLLTVILTQSFAQDEGTAVAQSRFERDKSIYITGGPSLTFGDNIGDYKNGINFEVGFNKRLNKVLSIGPSISYIKFKYDPEVTDVDGNVYIEDYGSGYYGGYVINLTGGDLSLISLACNFRLDFIPLSDNSKVAIYGFAKPFISNSKRTDVYGTSEYYESIDYGETWDLIDSDIDWGPDDYEALAEETKITGGVLLGPGVEFMPTKKVSLFLQVAIGYTFPVSYVSTSAYEPTADSYFDDEFPMVTEGFPSLNIQFGLSFNF